MLRQSDFTLSGEVDHLKDFEKKMLIEKIYQSVSKAMEYRIEFLFTDTNDYIAGHLYDIHRSEFNGARLVMTCLGIQVNYRGEKIRLLDIAEDIIAEFGSIQ